MPGTLHCWQAQERDSTALRKSGALLQHLGLLSVLQQHLVWSADRELSLMWERSQMSGSPTVVVWCVQTHAFMVVRVQRKMQDHLRAQLLPRQYFLVYSLVAQAAETAQCAFDCVPLMVAACNPCMCKVHTLPLPCSASHRPILKHTVYLYTKCHRMHGCCWHHSVTERRQRRGQRRLLCCRSRYSKPPSSCLQAGLQQEQPRASRSEVAAARPA